MARRRKASRPAATRPVFRRRVPGWVILLAVLALAAFGYLRPDGSGGAPVDVATPDRTYVVERVVDGDTFRLADGERVRLLGVDTPESVKPGHPVERLGLEASRFTKELVEGKAVRLGFDKERKDRYGRLLAYVYLDDLFLNEELIRVGFSEAQLQYPYSNAMKRRFQAAEDEAREARRGLWRMSGATNAAPDR